MRILFRTGGGQSSEKQLGFGHVYRCINLARNLKPHKIYFLVQDYGGVKRVLAEKGFNNVFFLRKQIDPDNDVKNTIRLIVSNKIDILVIDSYYLKQKYVYKIRKKIKTVVITDLNNIQYDADLVVSGFIGYKNQISKNRFGTKCLLGPKYQILDRRFGSKEKVYKKKYDLLATFGGFDDNKIAEWFLKYVQKYSKEIKSKIILGPFIKKSKNVLSIEKTCKNRIKIIERTNDMYKEIAESRFGICSGGLTTYEFAAVGVPFAIICQVKHQEVTAEVWKNKGIALNLGLINKKSQKKITPFLEDLVNKRISLKTPKDSVIDGKGAMRVAMEIIQMKQKSYDKNVKSVVDK